MSPIENCTRKPNIVFSLSVCKAFCSIRGDGSAVLEPREYITAGVKCTLKCIRPPRATTAIG